MEKLTLFFAMLACIFFLGSALSTYETRLDNERLRDELTQTKNTFFKISKVHSENITDLAKRIVTLDEEKEILQARVLLLEESIDPQNFRWAKTKAVRDAVRARIEKKGYDHGLGRTEDLTHYAGLVVRYSEEFDVPISFILALHERESHWLTTVVSNAGAIGIGQIMPLTGEDIAGEVRFRRYKLKHLYNYKVNTHFSVYYMSKMLDEFNRNIELAIRAYNTGPNNVRKVLAGIHPDYYDETNEYTRIILGDANTKGFIKYYEKLGL